MRKAAAIAVLTLGGLTGLASADVVNVDAKSVIFDAGHESGTLDGTLPPMIEIPVGADYLYLPEVTGLVRAHPALQWAGPDGNSTTLNDSDINSYQSISGLVHPRTLPLLGVFLGDGLPEGPAPSRLDFYSIGSDFSSLSPVSGQSFFIGDGWTDGEVNQHFMIPAGATRLYLGLADASYFTGEPGAYIDNQGSFTADVRFHVIPAPGSAALIGLGGLMTLRRRR
ncbi:MAG: hypothetical protein IPJ41_06955 [Phycisphaerales bacterium]|nr:hypothetical protein [Phycisphaerales bacterium]